MKTPTTISELGISPVALGCWPLAGITSGAITEEQAVAVIHTALDTGVNHLDTAYAYGRDGESERLIARAISGRRGQVVLATKVGVYWDEHGVLKLTGNPKLLRRHFEESLRRLETDAVELLYFHAPAEDAPLAESARFFREMLDAGKTRAVGVSNLSVAQMETFVAECPFVACQVRYNWFQREIESDVLPWCRAHNVGVVAYEPLAMGLLTGKFTRDHVFAPDDWRRQSALFTGEAWTKNLAEVERLRVVTARSGCSVAQLAVAWTISRPGVAVALCGAKRPDQIRETARAMFIAEPFIAQIEALEKGKLQ
ncbi:MAG: aldo/keto reductase [Verrucomicrobiia bacterium]|jgi:aryl-alcohol dehydrogenase-like predicted oxidoreductase